MHPPSSHHDISFGLFLYTLKILPQKLSFYPTQNWSAARDDRTKTTSLVAFVEREANDIFPPLS